jgi:hypothetical protein
MRLRRRRLALAVAASGAVHLAASIVLGPTLEAQQARGEPADAPTTIVQLVELPNLRPPAPTPPPPARAPAPTTATANLASAPGPPSVPASAAAGAASGDDGLYRVVFHDAVGQADAGMRAGLGCAHVDLHKLPGTVLALCDVASRRPADVALAIASRPTAPVWDRDWGSLVGAGGAGARRLPSLEAARDADKGVTGRGE